MSRDVKVVFPLHGIRTQAAWQKAFADVATRHGWVCRLERWSFGYFSVIRFLLPWQRATRVSWFRTTYRDEVHDRDSGITDVDRPSVIAHSFGTYILGNALLKYDYIRFNKIILCGSILPRDYPWGVLIDRGQVQAVRNEFGSNDIWTRFVGLVVRGAGASGERGFSQVHDRLEQEKFLYSHSEYFDKGHMESRWLPFLAKELPLLPPATVHIGPLRTNVPWLLYPSYGLISIAFFGLISIAPGLGIVSGAKKLLGIQTTTLATQATAVTPRRQEVRWGPIDGHGPGITIDGVEFLKWELLKLELEQKLLPQLQIDLLTNVPTGSRVEISEFQKKTNWVIEIRDPENHAIGRLWLGKNPDQGWVQDGLIRSGHILREGRSRVVWETYARYTDRTYRRVATDEMNETTPKPPSK